MAAILAGGNARRLGGVQKGLLAAAAGVTIIERLILLLRGSGLADIVIIANDAAPYAGCGCEILPDLRLGHGPLGGIEAALTRSSLVAEATLFLPCDLPAITAGEIGGLLAAFRQSAARIVYAQTGAFSHPLCSVVHNGCLPQVSAAIECGERKVSRLWQQLGALGVPFANERAFFNVNTSSDLASWQGEKREKLC